MAITLERIKINGAFASITGEDEDFYYINCDKILKRDVKLHKKGYGVFTSKSTMINKIKRLFK